MNETLRDYGGVASVPRDRLRTYTVEFLREGWPLNGVMRIASWPVENVMSRMDW